MPILSSSRMMLLHRRSRKAIPFIAVLLVSSAGVATASASSAGPPPLVVSSGLQNLGNTCYLNAQLQCAFHIPRVRNLITNAVDTTSEEEEDATTSSTSVALQALCQLFAEMVDHSSSSSSSMTRGNRRPVAPRQLCATLGIPVLEQQDSQEFWKLLLPALKLPKLMDLYQGAFEDYIVALDGSGRERRREEAFLDLSVDVAGGSNLQKSIARLFGEPELLSQADGNGWRPEKGADKVDAHKGTLLRSQGLPPILQLHLKRFQFDWMTGTTSKINDPLAFPEVLDLSTICEDTTTGSEEEEDDDDGGGDDTVLYDLQAVLVHEGEYGSGHYYCYVRPDVESDVWYRFNDHVVEQVELKDVLCDGYGGSHQLDNRPAAPKRGFFSRIFSAFQPQKIVTAGYGGSKSNAYVLQYVRRSDIPFLYQ